MFIVLLPACMTKLLRKHTPKAEIMIQNWFLLERYYVQHL